MIRRPTPPPMNGPRFNEFIVSPKVRVIDENGENLGVMFTREAIEMRPNIDDHDYDTKMKAVQKFLGEGDKVKITLRFRGRELAHGQLGMKLLQRVQEDTTEAAKVEQHPRMEGRQMLMVLSPK
jgi:translation initiation factor IF-3